jgi:polysaccharide pyruvyl transferase WcaK-like protein
MRYFLLNDTRSGLHHGCEIVMQNLIKMLSQQDSNAEILTLCTGQVISEEKWEMILQSIDVVLINGEGTLHDASPYGFFLLKLGLIAKLKNKFVGLINSTWEKNPDSWLDLIKDFDLITLRDQKSFNTLKKYNLAQLYYAPDLTFLSNHNELEKKAFPTDSIIVNDSVYAEVADELFTFARSRNLNYYPITRLLPTEKSAPGYNPQKNNKLRFYKLFSALSLGLYKPRRFYQDLLYAVDNTAEFKDKILQSDLVITGRYHCLCFCLQMQIPVLIIASNTDKMKNLLDDIGLGDRHITLEELKQLSNDELYQRAKYSDDELDKLVRFNHHAKTLHSNIFNAISPLPKHANIIY